MPTVLKRVYTVQEIMQILGICESTAYRMIKDKSIQSIRARTKILIPEWALNEYLNGTKEQGGTE